MIKNNGYVIDHTKVATVSELYYGFADSQKFELEIDGHIYFFKNKQDAIDLRLDILRAMGINHHNFTEEDLNPEFEDEQGNLI